MANANL